VVLIERAGEGGIEVGGDFDQRPEGLRRRERIAPSDHGADVGRERASERPEERGLADAGLAFDEDETTSLRPSAIRERAKARQGSLALEEVHRRIVRITPGADRHPV
jgi:hypothetical protein